MSNEKRITIPAKAPLERKALKTPDVTLPKEPRVTNTGFNKLSDQRRAQINAAASNAMDLQELSQAPDIRVAHSKDYKQLYKRGFAGAVSLPTNSYMSDVLGPDVYSPLYQLANMNLPRDRNTVNAWNRVFYDLHPMVRNAINLHASYPISKINISHPNKKVHKFFLDMAERLDLYSVIYGAALEFWKQGECFPYAELDAERNTWKKITILNPDYIDVRKSPIGNSMIISLIPDAAIKRIVNSTNPQDIVLKRKLSPHVIEAVKKGKSIPLDNINISHLKLLSSPYDVRGTSIIQSVWKLLMQYDKLMESKYAQADGMINPLTVATLGGSEGYRPTQGAIDSLKNTLEEAQYDKNYVLVTHDGVKIERVGYNGGIMDISSDLEFITNNLYIGLMTPKSIVDQEGASYSSSSIGLEVLRQRYDIFRNMLKKWLEQKIFAPISEMQEFFEYSDGEKHLLVPTVDFNHMNLYDMADYVSSIKDLVSNEQISKQTLCRSLGLDYEEELRRLKKERIDKAIAEKESTSLGAMRLRELEALTVDSIIPEPPDDAEPAGGDGGGLSLPGVPGLMGGPDSGGGGGDLGPPPDLGAGGGGGGPPAPPPAE